MADGIVMFAISLKAIGTSGSSSAIAFSETPLPREVSVNVRVVPFDSPGGMVTVGSGGEIQPPSLSVRRAVPGQIALQLIGQSGVHYTIQGSANLIEWTPLMRTNTADGTIEFTEPDLAGLPLRFYRAVSE